MLTEKAAYLVGGSALARAAAVRLLSSQTARPWKVKPSRVRPTMHPATSWATSASLAARKPPQQAPPPCPEKVKFALCQLAVGQDKEVNIGNAQNAILAAAAKGADIVMLPEMWNCPYSNASFPTYAEDIEGGRSPSVRMMAETARSCGVTVVGGSIPECCGDKLYNSCCVFDTQGALKAKHRKVHLFDIDIPGKISFRESDTLTAGDGLTLVDTAVGRLALGICYDIRFPEMAMLAAAKGAHILCYPGAFNMTTGPMHWELLQRARAVDNQMFVATCSPARDAKASYVAYGHSMIVGPLGDVICSADHLPGTVIATLDMTKLEECRRNMPLQMQRRGDIYMLEDVKAR